MHARDVAPIERLGQLSEELEDSGLRPLVLAEGLVVHDDVYARLGAVGDPVGPLVHRQRPVIPLTVEKAELDAS